MGEERAVEPREILRRTRIEVTPYLRHLAGHRRALLPRMEISRRWISYYDALSKTRPLVLAETRRLEAHRKALSLASSRIDVLRAAGRYSRTKKPTDLLALRQAQSRYYEAKAVSLPPEKEAEMREKLVPPKEVYEEFGTLREDIEEKCKRFTAVKYRTTPATAVMGLIDRYLVMKDLGSVLREEFAKAYDLSQKGMTMSELIEHYREMKGER